MVEPEGGDPLRTWRVGAPEGAEVDGDGALFRFLRQGQRSITGDIEAHIDAADVVIVDLDGPDPAGLRATRPGLVVLSITPYGRTGPYRDRPATEFTMQCDVGSTAGRGLLWQEPYQAGGRTGEWFAASVAAVASSAALRRQALTGHGETIDLSIAEAISLAMTMFSDLQASLSGRMAPGPARVQETPSIEPTKDGYVGFNTNTRQQLGDFCLMAGQPERADEFATARMRTLAWDDWNALVHAYTTQHTTAEIIEFASMLRIPVAPVGNGKSVLDMDHFVERGMYIDSADRSFKQPRRPWRIDGQEPPAARSAPTIGADDAPAAPPKDRPPPDGSAALPFAGLRVIDATAWWAGPTCTNVLATLGADVIHVESCARPDGMRMIGGYFKDEPQWWEWSFIFAGANTNKRDLTLDLSTERGRELFVDLAATADIVVENYTPRVFENFGFDYATLAADNPSLIFARMPGFGLNGPWRDRPGFAQTMEQVSGLAWATGHRDDQPRIQKGPCDPNAGMHAVFAITGALIRRDQTGQGAELELPMVEAALSVAAEQVIEHTAYGTLMERGGNRSPYAAPQGIYKANADESWVGLAVETDEQWRSCATIIDRPDLAGLTAAERRGRHDELDAAIEAWSSKHDEGDAADALLAAGVPAAIVRDPRLTYQHPHLIHRGYQEYVQHPVLGEHPIATMPFRFDGVDSWIHSPAPTLGQHNHEILTELGLSTDEIAQLETDGVIGDKIVGA